VTQSFSRVAITRPLVHEFSTEQAAQEVMQVMAERHRDYPVADGDVLTVPSIGAAWLACGPDMLPVASVPSGRGRYPASIRLARGAIADAAAEICPPPHPPTPSPAAADSRPRPILAQVTPAAQSARPARRPGIATGPGIRSTTGHA
jgi:hypothetical protein